MKPISTSEKIIGTGYMGLPVYLDGKHQECHKIKDVAKGLVVDVNSSNHFERRVKTMNKDIQAANESAEDALLIFENSMVKVIKKQAEIADSAKKVSGTVRQAANELGEGLAKLEKTANFHNLEKYADLLDRCANSLSILAELQKNGMLEKIGAAIK